MACPPRSDLPRCKNAFATSPRGLSLHVAMEWFIGQVEPKKAGRAELALSHVTRASYGCLGIGAGKLRCDDDCTKNVAEASDK